MSILRTLKYTTSTTRTVDGDSMSKMGRPRKNINDDQFKKLCALQCTLKEIAAFFDVSEDTIQRWCKREHGQTFAVLYDKYRQTGFISLRRAQFELAQKSASMAIFLGKQYLGQKDETYALRKRELDLREQKQKDEQW